MICVVLISYIPIFWGIKCFPKVKSVRSYQCWSLFATLLKLNQQKLLLISACWLLKWSIHNRNSVLRWMEIFPGQTAGWFKLPMLLHAMLCELLYFGPQTVKISHYSLSVYQPQSSGGDGGHGTSAHAAATAAGRGIADGHDCFLPGSSSILLQGDHYNCVIATICSSVQGVNFKPQKKRGLESIIWCQRPFQSFWIATPWFN